MVATSHRWQAPGWPLLKVLAGCVLRMANCSFQPFIPAKMGSFSFHVGFRGALLNIKVSKDGVQY
jgi:maltose phosphorylase